MSELRPGDVYEEVTFESLDLASETLTEVEFRGCSLVGCRLPECNLVDCIFDNCEFTRCDLSVAQLGRSSFRGVRFQDCKLVGINWTQAAIGLEVAFEGCQMSYGSFVGLKLDGLQMVGCTAERVNFAEAGLKHANFSGTSLLDSRFSRTDLSDADFSKAVHYSFDLQANLTRRTRVSFDGAVGLLRQFGLVIVEIDDP